MKEQQTGEPNINQALAILMLEDRTAHNNYIEYQTTEQTYQEFLEGMIIHLIEKRNNTNEQQR